MEVHTWRDDGAPESWAEVLAKLKQFERSAQSLAQTKESKSLSQEEQDTLYASHDHLVELASERLPTQAALDVEAALFDQVFVEAVLLTPYYRELVYHPGVEILDTAGSRTFSLFIPDYSGEAADEEALKERLRTVFQIDDAIFGELTTRLAEQTEPLRDRQKIVGALDDLFNLASHNPQLDDAVFRMFQRFYPDSPFQAGQVKLIKTASAIFFCLPFDESTIPGWDKITETNKARYRQFLHKIQQIEPFAHFPVFGPFEGETATPDLLDQIVARSELSYEQVTTTLTRMVGTLPLDEVDKYLIHDTWGHQWQESLLDFEEPYTQLARFDLPLSLKEQASVLGQQSGFADAFFRTGADEIALDAAKLRKFIDDELYERSVVALTPVLAEMLADVVEYKFLTLHPEKAELLPSSSLLKTFPTKFDLTLQDLHFCFDQASKVFRERVASTETQQQLQEQLLDYLKIPHAKRTAVLRQNVREVVGAAAHICEERLEIFYRPDWFWEKGEGSQLTLNAFSLMALNFLSIHAVLLKTYDTLSATASSVPGMQSFKDLLVLAMGVFFEKDPQRHLWLMDEFLVQGFLPRWEKWTEARDSNAN